MATSDTYDMRAALDLLGVDYRDTGARNITVLCPVHSEGRPSCSIDLDKGVWSCHSCGKSGGVTALLKEAGVDARAAAEAGAIKTGGARGSNGRVRTESPVWRRPWSA